MLSGDALPLCPLALTIHTVSSQTTGSTANTWPSVQQNREVESRGHHRLLKSGEGQATTQNIKRRFALNVRALLSSLFNLLKILVISSLDLWCLICPLQPPSPCLTPLQGWEQKVSKGKQVLAHNNSQSLQEAACVGLSETLF